jgi:hypothetical protein
MIMEIAGVLAALAIALCVAVLVYAQARTLRASSSGAFLTSRNGRFAGAVLRPMTLWDPRIRVLRGDDAPRLTCLTRSADGAAAQEKILIHARTGEVSLRVHVCAPHPFIVRTAENRQLRITARAAFRFDPDRLDILTQMDEFGSLLAGRLQNAFENEIGAHENEHVRSRQTAIEATVLARLQDIEAPSDPDRPRGMPLGIIVLEATFSFEPVAADNAPPAVEPHRGAMTYSPAEIDELADLIEKTDPRAMETITRMIELQTRQNIVDMLCRSGGMVAFTAPELGLTDLPVGRRRHGANAIAPPTPPATAPGSAVAAAGDAPVSYYDLPPPGADQSTRPGLNKP